MKSSIKNIFFLPLFIASFGLMLSGPATAQTFTTLHHFAGYPIDGAKPFGGLVLAGKTLYGTAWTGGNLGSGAIFAVNTDGSSFTNLHHFAYTDGSSPYAGLILSGSTLYGTTYFGGSEGDGTVFAINTNGSGFTNLHAFTVATDGANPSARLILSGSTLYGTTEKGGGVSDGTVFALNTNGTGFANLLTFMGSNGSHPHGELVLSSNKLYGTTGSGGSFSDGTVFALNTNGTGYTNLYNFSARVAPASTNGDGANPYAGLTLSGSKFFGTTYAGGSAGNGTVFAINTDGSGFANLHSFASGIPIETNEDGVIYSNAEGINPNAGLVLVGNILYGTAVNGGAAGEGAIFALHTDGSSFTNLHNFTEESDETNDDGTNPNAGLIFSGNTLYGTANHAGAFGFGTVFALSLPVPPSLKIVKVVNNVVLSWPTNDPGFVLQSITNLSAMNWSNITSGITVAGTNFVFTNAINGKAAFFRLKQ